MSSRLVRKAIVWNGLDAWLPPPPGNGFASPGRLSTMTIPIAPASRTRAAFESNVQLPRQTSAIAPLSEPGARGVELGSFGSPIGAHTYLSLLIAAVSTSRCELVAHASGMAPASTNGIGCGPAAGETTVSA